MAERDGLLPLRYSEPVRGVGRIKMQLAALSVIFVCQSLLSLRLKLGQKKMPPAGVAFLWRRETDSNPRYPFEVYTLSRRAPSTTRTPLQKD
jgi:hypothetical protein